MCLPPEEAEALTAGDSVCLKTWYCSSGFTPWERNNPTALQRHYGSDCNLCVQIHPSDLHLDCKQRTSLCDCQEEMSRWTQGRFLQSDSLKGEMLKRDPVIKLQEWERRVEQKNSPQEDGKIYLKGGEGEQDNRSERMGRNKSKAHYTL